MTSTCVSRLWGRSGRLEGKEGLGLDLRSDDDAPEDRETHVLVMLTLEGKAAEVTRDFQKVIETMPAKFQMKPTSEGPIIGSSGSILTVDSKRANASHVIRTNTPADALVSHYDPTTEKHMCSSCSRSKARLPK
jgi:hypothetical protein